MLLTVIQTALMAIPLIIVVLEYESDIRERVFENPMIPSPRMIKVDNPIRWGRHVLRKLRVFQRLETAKKENASKTETKYHPIWPFVLWPSRNEKKIPRKAIVDTANVATFKSNGMTASTRRFA